MNSSSTNTEHRAVVVMTRYPEPGKTKTRLESALTPEQCAEFHWACLEDIASQVKGIDADVILWVEGLPGPEDGSMGAHSEAVRRSLSLFARDDGCKVMVLDQTGSGFGERMRDGFDRAFGLGYREVVMVGGDVPQLSTSDLVSAFDALGDHDCVIQPSHDGGFCMIGLSRPIEGIFDLGSYGHREVFDHTMEAMDATDSTCFILDGGYDIDTIEDLEGFLERARDHEDRTFKAAEVLGHIPLSIDEPTGARYSVVVPVFNEIAIVDELLDHLDALAREAEVILVDGNSTDGTYEHLRDSLGRRGASYLGEVTVEELEVDVDEIIEPRVLSKPGFRLMGVDKGRGNQLDSGAIVSKGKRLLFLHADSKLPAEPIRLMDEALGEARVGCFGVSFPMSNILMLTNRIASNARARRGIMFGDQGIFIERKLFFEMGMFPDIPFMEDYAFSLALKEAGARTAMATEHILTSNRRYPKSIIGTAKVMREMFKLRKAFRSGTSADELLELYPDVR